MTNIKKRGFSLIEMSIIITILAGMLISMLEWITPPNISNMNKAIATKEKMEDIATAIETFYTFQGRLPCPSQTADNTETLDLEYPPIGSFDGTYGQDCADTTGTVPIASLGLSPTHDIDEWNNKFTYHVSPPLCGSDTIVTTENHEETPEDIILQSTRIGCNEFSYINNEGTLTVNRIEGTDNITLTNVAAFVLVSHGPNGSGAFLRSGTQLPVNENNLNELENADNDEIYIITVPKPELFEASTEERNTAFDDLVLYRTKVQIYQNTLPMQKNIMSQRRCNENSLVLGSLTAEEIETMQTNNLAPGHVLQMLKKLQDLCIEYYGITPTGDWDGPECPADGSYDEDNNSCECASGDWSNC